MKRSATTRAVVNTCFYRLDAGGHRKFGRQLSKGVFRSTFPAFGWEVGEKKFFFALALNGYRANPDAAIDALVEAPALDSWELLAGRPRVT